ncbi:uncharacterized protein L969DRAFT_55197 [Mixia osmundae IAM 14324]|uniref:Ribosomal RNA-processing protein 8 n=1 Tax=Mixia osmundae (strain CBS 9802 / IAM 14324 / JCM 22182 / KY 12970) TaxID=764103 RepID=G7DUK7_MIXOS|nr:uncharacterized protein L969DRAFT_55197 [Mixia osmundae IAM 14324]KEI36399.1 hypothetical protein L969DRAFT_55197 [Mixia osmundae IAM 14324]GAA94267.1 hypothetical protein E5Q_00916 [Mixia osmundae IAM 14324]
MTRRQTSLALFDFSSTLMLFEVPGWSVGEPADVGDKQKKRKRPKGSLANATLADAASSTATLNVEASLANLKRQAKPSDAPTQSEHSTSKRNKRRKRNAERQAAEDATQSSKEPSLPTDAKLGPPANGGSSLPQKPARPAKAVFSPSALSESLQSKLGGARFRWINEQLYTTTGDAALSLVQDDPSLFDEYHVGFRSQASSWPTNPLDLILAKVRSASKPYVIADLGCGDARLAQTLVPQGYTVLSFDLVDRHQSGWIIQAQCNGHVPLPGARDTPGAQIVDAVVCCLSLMGTDWIKSVTEASRILKQGGLFHMAEVVSRFTDVKAFLRLVQQAGFTLSKTDKSNTHFILFEFRKTGRATENEDDLMKLSSDLLKPCVYKKR